MKKTDRQLGMHRDISRRDFIHDTSLASLGLGLPAGALAEAVSGNPESAGKYYPPTRTGLRGSHPGSFEVAHKVGREGRQFEEAADFDEEYDLLIVGAGISGLAAAHYYRERFGEDARILILENHDDFGGHAKRNEFHQGGEMRLALGGTHNLEYPRFSQNVSQFMEGLGVNIDRLKEQTGFRYGFNGERGPAIWFDAETYGRNELVTGASFQEFNAGTAPLIERFPISDAARERLKRFCGTRKNVYEGQSDADVEARLKKTSWFDFLKQHGGLQDEELQLFRSMTWAGLSASAEALSARECIWHGLPGGQLLGWDEQEWDYRMVMFPDGNASIARLQVHSLIPEVAPGVNAGNIALARFDYSQLDRPGSPVRLRLNSTVVRVRNDAQGVAVSYVNDGKTRGVRARHCVLACYHVVIPHLCPQMPDTQKEAQKYQVKTPLLLTNVLLRDSAALDRLGIAGAHCPGRMHASCFLFRGNTAGGYRQGASGDGSVAMTFWGSLTPPMGLSVKEQYRVVSAMMLELSFEDYEREVRTVLDGILGPAGFDVQKDILAITVNRWPHGYAYYYMDLWDPDFEPGQYPHEIARQPFGNISIANADADADAYTHVAIDQAFRAVGELPA